MRSGGLLLSGELPLRFYSSNFALRKPSWSLPDYGGVQALSSAEGSGLGIVEFRAARSRESPGGCWTKGAGGTWKRMRLTKKNGQFVGSQVWCSPCPFMVLGGRDFVLLMRLWVLGLTVIRGDVSHCMSIVSFPREGVG